MTGFYYSLNHKLARHSMYGANYLLTYKAGWEEAHESWKRNKWHVNHGGKEQSVWKKPELIRTTMMEMRLEEQD